MTRRTRHQLRCQCCGLLFPSMHPSAKWCSNACTQHAFRQRRKAAALVAQPAAIDDELPLAWSIPTDHDARIWNGTTITRRQTDGYVNATAMCKANGREWFTYIRADRTQDYLSALRDHLNWIPEDPTAHISPCIDAPELVISIKGGTPELQGTWIHPLLAVDLARWISPRFAVWMDSWFLQASTQPAAPPPTPSLPPGVHVVANNPRHANWLWAQAVEAHLSAVLMHSLARDNRHAINSPHFQPHLTHSLR